jgi:hypothetical protein
MQFRVFVLSREEVLGRPAAPGETPFTALVVEPGMYLAAGCQHYVTASGPVEAQRAAIQDHEARCSS